MRPLGAPCPHVAALCMGYTFHRAVMPQTILTMCVSCSCIVFSGEDCGALRDSLFCCRVDESSKLSPSSKLIYIINCLAPMHEALAGRACAAGKARELAQAMEAHTARLVGGECGQLLSRCGMAEVVERVRWASAHGKYMDVRSDP